MSNVEMMSGEAIKDLLRTHGLQLTMARVAVLQVLQATEGHLSAEEIHAAVLARYPVLNLVTVYRTLETFAEHGLAVKAVFGDKLVRWEHGAYAHHHLVCAHCGHVVEFNDAPFQQLASTLAHDYGVRAVVRHLSLDGLCAACAANDSAPQEHGIPEA